MKRGKKYQEALKKIDRSKEYTLQEAAELVKSCAYAKFTETVELSVALSLKKSIEDKYSEILRDAVKGAIKGENLLELIKTALSGDVSGKVVEISTSDMDALRSSLSSVFASEIKAGLTVRSSSFLSGILKMMIAELFLVTKYDFPRSIFHLFFSSSFWNPLIAR